MPELPDLAVVAEAFHAALAGRAVVSATAPGPLAVRGTPAELAALAGQAPRSVHRRGKFVELALDRDRIIVNAMLTGRFQLAEPGAKLPAKTAVVLRFGSRVATAARLGALDPRRRLDAADDDAEAEIRYRDPTQMGKVYLVPGGSDRPVPGHDASLGPDADDPGLTLEAWRERIRRHPGELKPLLRNQLFVAGIGNAYSDEILHAARLNPFRKRSTLASEEIDELYRATRTTLGERDRDPARASAPHVRDAGAGLPRRAPEGRRSPARDAGRGSARCHRGARRPRGAGAASADRRRACSPVHGISRTRPTRMVFEVSPFRSLIAATVVPKLCAIP